MCQETYKITKVTLPIVTHNEFPWLDFECEKRHDSVYSNAKKTTENSTQERFNPINMVEDFREHLSTLEKVLENIRSDMTHSAGNRSVCEIHKSGTPSNFLKFTEGKEMVFRGAVRVIKKGGSRSDVMKFLVENRKTMMGYKTSEVAISDSWQSYADGGLVAVEMISDLFRII